MKKYFTQQEANATLVFITPIVRDILEKRFQAISITNDVKKLKENTLLKESDLHEKLDHAEKFLDAVNYHMRELEKVGCVMKDSTLGLVDFPSLRDGKEVSLCWRYGESAVSFWHETNSGYAGRKPIQETPKAALTTPSL